jgi:transposase
MRRFWIKEQFPLDTFIALLGKHLQTFRELEDLQTMALQAVNNQMPEGLTTLITKQAEILASISREKSELRPFLDQWEGLQPEERRRLRAGKAESILADLENIAHSIQAKHQKMFGEEENTNTSAGTSPGSNQAGEAKQPNLSQTINIYRSLQ